MERSMRLTRRLAAIPPDAPSAGARVSVAVTAEERLEAARLVGRLYRAEGYLGWEAEPDAPFLTPHHLLPESTVFIAREADRIAGTVTVVLDSHAGLPMEAVYGREVRALRASGRTPCEICSLAVDAVRLSRSSRILLSLFRIANAYLVHFTGASDALITLKPSHAEFYGERLRFRPFGALKADPRFRGAETVALRQTREGVEDAARLAPRVFGAPTREEQGALFSVI